MLVFHYNCNERSATLKRLTARADFGHSIESDLGSSTKPMTTGTAAAATLSAATLSTSPECPSLRQSLSHVTATGAHASPSMQHGCAPSNAAINMRHQAAHLLYTTQPVHMPTKKRGGANDGQCPAPHHTTRTEYYSSKALGKAVVYPMTQLAANRLPISNRTEAYHSAAAPAFADAPQTATPAPCCI
jgi:hypothetical protein